MSLLLLCCGKWGVKVYSEKSGVFSVFADSRRMIRLHIITWCCRLAGLNKQLRYETENQFYLITFCSLFIAKGLFLRAMQVLIYLQCGSFESQNLNNFSLPKEYQVEYERRYKTKKLFWNKDGIGKTQVSVWVKALFYFLVVMTSETN